MVSQEQRQGYIFRPTTNDSTNLSRYDEQANLWYRAFKSAENKNKPTNYKETFNTIGLLFSLVAMLVTSIILLMVQFIKWLRS